MQNNNPFLASGITREKYKQKIPTTTTIFTSYGPR